MPEDLRRQSPEDFPTGDDWAFIARRGNPLPPPLQRRRGFGASEVSFGPTGRIILTVLSFVPLYWFWFALGFPLGLGGAAVYGCLLLPWILKDLWRKG